MGDKAIIEAALNGGTPKSANPHVPRTPDEIAEDAVQCLEAGAAIVHNHNDEPVIGKTVSHDPEPYIRAWRAILAAFPEAVLYPTMGTGGPHTTIEQRYSHIPALARAGLLGQGLVDPGSVNMGGAGPDGLPRPVDHVYINTYNDLRYMFDTCVRMGRGASISCFEPGFVRVVLAYRRAGRIPPGSLVKLYFGGAGPEGDGLNFGLPPTKMGLEAYLAMVEPTGLPWSVAVQGGDVVESGMARWALERGGHVRVGLEDYSGKRKPANRELVTEVAALCRAVGRPVASCGEARKILGIPIP
jgi:3-keto-5-aminohexanoate cleavage enzyme